MIRILVLLFLSGASLAACTIPPPPPDGALETVPQACTATDRVLKFGFYAYFDTVSYSADADPASAAFHTHRGYEADLLTALETMADIGLTLERYAIAEWDGIWLKSASAEYDMVGGGITILDSRTRDVQGNPAVTFTSGHIAFQQSLLVRAEDVERLARYDDLGEDVRIGVLAGTTGEARLLVLTGLADAAGVLQADVRIRTPEGELVATGDSCLHHNRRRGLTGSGWPPASSTTPGEWLAPSCVYG